MSKLSDLPRRLVRPMGDWPVSSEGTRKRKRENYQKHREKRVEAERRRYWSKR